MRRLETLFILTSITWLIVLACLPGLHDEQAGFILSVAVIGLNAAFALWALTRKRRILVALNCIQIVLFGVLNYQMFATWGEEHQ